MQIIIAVALVLIVLILLGALGPVLYIAAAALFALSGELLTGLAVGAAAAIVYCIGKWAVAR